METKNHGLKKFPNRTLNDITTIVKDNGDKVWNVQSLAEELGTSVHSIRKRIQRGVIPAHKEGRSWYILKSEYIQNLRKK